MTYIACTSLLSITILCRVQRCGKFEVAAADFPWKKLFRPGSWFGYSSRAINDNRGEKLRGVLNAEA